jgi:hypothetical protein
MKIVKQLETFTCQREEDHVAPCWTGAALDSARAMVPALPLQSDSADTAATSTSLANSTSGASFSSGGIATPAAGRPLPVGHIGHLHYPLVFLPSTNNDHPSPPFYSSQLPPNINESHFAPPPYSPNPSPCLPCTYHQQQPYHQQLYQKQQQPQIIAAFTTTHANPIHMLVWPHPSSTHLWIHLAHHLPSAPAKPTPRLRFRSKSTNSQHMLARFIFLVGSANSFYVDSARTRLTRSGLQLTTNDAHFWYLQLERGFGMPTWEQFKEVWHVQFGPSLHTNPLGELARLSFTSSVSDYTRRFLAHVSQQ